MKHFYTFTLTFIMLCFYGEAQNLLTNSTFADVAAWTVVNTTGSLNTDSHTDDGTGSYELLAQDGNTNGHIKHNQIIASNLQPGDYVMTCWVKGGIGSRVKLQVFHGLFVKSTTFIPGFTSKKSATSLLQKEVKLCL